MIRKVVKFLDQRSGTAPFIRKALRYVFPDHWSFLLGEVALYAFVVLVGTGIYLTLFFEPSTADAVYKGTYGPLQGLHMSQAYRSTVDISFDVKAGLFIRQTHHWAADVFVASIVLHMLRVFFTGAFRKPRDVTYYLGIAMLGLALLEGYLGYSMVDDLLSGMGLAIGYSVALSIPFIGAEIAQLVWGAPFPGDPQFMSRMYIGHVFLLPLAIATMLGLHLFLIAARHHTQFKRRKESESKVVGVPTFPGQVPRSLGLFFAVAAVLFLLGGLVQINPIWMWGPYDVANGTNGAQPDWYLGWLIGALRMVPDFDVNIGGYTLVPNPFWGGILFPTAVFGILFLWPSLERRLTGDKAFHNLVDRPRDAPMRTAFGAAFFAWVFIPFLAGASDRVFLLLGISYEWQIWVYRVLFFVAPVLVFFVTRRVCEELQAGELVEKQRKRAAAPA
ncbi:MAG: cytochrome bc complex cytochrome b subunit [Actinobacteria bacterium]|nr:cytochrome bc complex cytochrome b subunit [Actinomycetota bacterium]